MGRSYPFCKEFSPIRWELTLSATHRFALGSALGRRFVRGALNLVLLGSTADSITAQGFVLQVEQRAGQVPSFAFRLGGEAELLHDLLQARAGTYLEPARAADRSARLHATAGLELRLFHLIYTWKLTWAFDIAPRYSNTSIGIGIWH